VDQESIERIRSATFPSGRRGYDKREVDRFLTRLADWLETGGADQSRAEVVRLELERVGEQTAKILTDAHDAAETLRVQTERETQEAAEAALAQAEETRAEADRYAAEAPAAAEAEAQKTTTEADTYASQTRTDADREAEQEIEKARDEAKRLVDEANARKGDIEAVIADLEQRREEVLASLRRMSSELAGTATEHGSVDVAVDGDEAEPIDDDDAADEAEAEVADADTKTMPVQSKSPR
jgi:DivIVA domain-containing protein